jgi:F-type H+-transporting ATPase subunit a
MSKPEVTEAATEGATEGAVEAVAHSGAAESAVTVSEAVESWVMGHVVGNPHSWHLPFGIEIPLPLGLKLHGFMVILTTLILIVLFCMIYNKRARVPQGLTNLLEVFVVFVRDDVSIACLGKTDGKRMAPFFCTMFFFICAMNVLGLIPIFATATGNINVTGALAVVVFLLMTVGAVLKNGPVNFVKAFIPPGVPWPILLIVTPLEMVGVLVKCAALMIRLFANMMAGHIALFCIFGLCLIMGVVAWVPAVIVGVGVYVLEVFIAFLQAYIFTMLSAMFIGQIYHPAH